MSVTDSLGVHARTAVSDHSFGLEQLVRSIDRHAQITLPFRPCFSGAHYIQIFPEGQIVKKDIYRQDPALSYVGCLQRTNHLGVDKIKHIRTTSDTSVMNLINEIDDESGD